MTANTWFKVKGQRSRSQRNLCEFVAYLTMRRGVAPRDLHLWLPGGTSKTQYFRTKKTQKMLIICQIDWREVGVAFELQCFRNCTLSSIICKANCLWGVTVTVVPFVYEAVMPMVGVRALARTSIVRCQATRASGIVGNDMAGVA